MSDNYCRNCGAEFKTGTKYCPKCGKRTSERSYKLPIITAIAIVLIAVAAISMMPQTQVVSVDNVKFEIPSSYTNLPSRTEVSYDEGVKSSAMGWSNNDTYIEIGITTTPGNGFNSEEIASGVGGSPTRLLGYDGYYQKYDEESYSFVFGMKDKVCMVYVSDYDAFEDIKVIG